MSVEPKFGVEKQHDNASDKLDGKGEKSIGQSLSSPKVLLFRIKNEEFQEFKEYQFCEIKC